MLHIATSSNWRKPRIKRPEAARKVAASLQARGSGELVSAFLAATLGDVRATGDRFEASAYGYRATSTHGRVQAVRNWIDRVSS